MSEKKAPKLMTTTPNPRCDWILEDKMYNEFVVRFSEPISACFYFFKSTGELAKILCFGKQSSKGWISGWGDKFTFSG